MEKILCIPTGVLFGEADEHYFNGFMPASEHDFTETIRKNKRFLLRNKSGYFQPLTAENDPGYKQIIPYLVFRHKKKIFMFKRFGEEEEKRLRNLYSIGIGGHINPVDDIPGGDFMEACIRREISEEVELGCRYTKKLLGFINADNARPVDKFHFGVLYLIDLKSPKIRISYKEKSVNEGSLVDISEAERYTEFMETWSRIAFEAIRS